MTDGLTALASENINPSLRSLLEDVQRGHIRVPRFQRPFIWTDRQRMELLRSIRDNMPIGSLLIWRTSRFRLASFPNIGPHLIPEVAVATPATGWQYVLDGHQRLTTLLGMLFKPSASFEVIEDWDIQYSLEDQDFVFGRRFEKNRDFVPLLPLWTLLDGRLVNRHMRELRVIAAVYGCSEDEMDDWEERANQLAYRFQQCRVPVVIMVSDDLELAAKTFQRVNSLGTPMGEAHLVTALTWSKDFDLRERIEDLRTELPVGWRSLDEGVYLQVCKGLLGLDITKAAQADFASHLFKNPDLLPRAGTCLQIVLEWLTETVGVVREDLLPYMLQVVLMAIQVDREKNSYILPTFEDWFWRTSWSEVFSSATYRQVREEQDVLDGTFSDVGEMEWVHGGDLPERFDFRSSRVRLFALRMAKRPNILDGFGGHEDGKQLLVQHGREALIRLFPTPYKATAELKALLQGPGNRFLLRPGHERVLRERLQGEPDGFSDNELESLLISRSSLQGLAYENDLTEFLIQRKQRVLAWDKSEWEDCHWSAKLR